MKFFGRRKEPMTFDEELAAALNYCTSVRFASLGDSQQGDGYKRLGRALELYGQQLEEGDA